MFWNVGRSKEILQMIDYLYLILDGLAIAGPLALSFDKRVAYVREWKHVFIATILVAIPFLIHDAFFTEWGYWGFNPKYLTEIYLLKLPIEEILFFVVVPFSCTFIYACVRYYFRKFDLRMIDRLVQIGIIAYAAILAYLNSSAWYTLSVVIVAPIIVLIWLFRSQIKYIGLSFLISLIPFFIMNGILTGSFLEEPIVWYNENEKVNGRMFTIPYEDLLYGFILIVGVIMVYERLRKKNEKDRTTI